MTVPADRIPSLTGLPAYQGLATQPADLIAEDPDMVLLGTYPPAVLLLAAIGVGGQVREEWGCRLTWPDGETEDHWGEALGGSRTLADTRVALHDGVRTKTTGTLIRRFVIITTAVEVTE